MNVSETQLGEGRQLAKYPVASGAPRWITPESIADTIQTWQPYYRAQLTEEDAVQILLSVGELFDVLECTS